MDNQTDHDTLSIEDRELNQLQISPAGEGDVKSWQSSGSTKINESLDSTNELSASNTAISQSTKKSFFSRFFRDTGFSRDTGTLPSFASEEPHKHKTNSLGKLFRNKSASISKQENFNQTVVNQTNSPQTPSEQSFKKSFASFFNTFRGSRTHAASLPWTQVSNEETNQLGKQRGGSLGKFFRYGQGKRDKSENQENKQTTNTLKEIDSDMIFPLVNLFSDWLEQDMKSSVPKENQMSSSSDPMIELASPQRSADIN